MGESKIAFGDKIFLYGQYLQYLYEFSEYEYNSVMGYMTVGGYLVYPIETDVVAASIPGFVVEISLNPQFTVETPFNQAEMVNIVDKLSKQTPLPSGTKVWMPTTL